MQSRKIAFSAVMTAISWILIALTRITPIGVFSLFVLCELAVFCVFLNSGALAGALVCLANLLFSLLFLPSGLLFIFGFAPHVFLSGLFSILYARFSPMPNKKRIAAIILRTVVVLIVFNISLFIVFKLSGMLFLSNAITNLIDSYFWVAVCFSIIFAVYDFFFFCMEKRLKAILRLDNFTRR